MLVSKLYKLFDVKLKKERSVLNECHGFGDGIWDIIGYYNPLKYEITICDSRIEEHVRKLAKSIEYDEVNTNLVLRELVRLHEHAHSLLHTGKLSPLRRFKNGYRNLPPTVNEPVTEFIAWSTVQKFGTKFFERVFEEVDKSTPDYYKRWKQIKQVIDNKSRKKMHNEYVYYIPGLIYLARKGVWKDFNSFLGEMSQEWKTILAIVIAELI